MNRRGLRRLRVVAVTCVVAAGGVVTSAQPAAAVGPTIVVDRTDDTAAASACTAAADDCSLRGASLFANANPGTKSVPGTTISIPAGTYQLTIAGSPGETDGLCGDPNVGDLDFSGNHTIVMGAGAASTIIQQTTSDRVICANPDVVDDFVFHLSGVHVTGGRETTGVGGAGYVGGSFESVTSFSDCIFSNNQITASAGIGGGAIGSQGGDLTITNCFFGGANPPGASQTDTTLANLSGTSGAAVSFMSGDILCSPCRTTTHTLTLTNSTFINNVANSGAAGGGGLDTFAANNPGGNGIANVTGSTFTGNRAPNAAGGAIVVESGELHVSNSTFTSNTAGFNGGAIYGSGFATVTKSLFTSNQVTDAMGHGGAIGQAASGAMTVSFSRFVGNTAATPANGNTVSKYSGGSGSTFVASNNWWSRASGANATDVSGTVTTTPFLRNRTTASPGTIVTNQTTALTTSFNTNSADADVSANIDVLLGLPVSWSAVGGTISGAQPSIQTSGGGKGTATATYTATAAAAGNSATAQVDNGPASGSANTGSITVNKADTTAEITNAAAVSGTTSVTGQPVTVNFSVAGAFGNSPTAPTGSVTVSDGTDSCTGTVAAGTCELTFRTAGAKTLTATYLGDGNFNPSPASASVSHTVNKADTTTITSDAPDPSVTGETVTFDVSVAAVAPGAAVPPTTITGMVTVSDGGTNTCDAVLTAGAGSCMIAFPTAGPYSLTAVYAGDANFNGSASAGEEHQVNKADTTTTVTSDDPDPSEAGQVVTVVYSVVVSAPGAGTPTGNVTVGDGVDSCMATVAAGQCDLTLTTVGGRSLTATYAGDANFNGSVSAGEPHSVDEWDTTTSITSDSPDPSVVGQPLTVEYSVTSLGGTPTGDVTVSDGVDSCMATVAAGQCDLTLTTVGARTLTATYVGDANFDGSASAGEAHTVNGLATTTSITSDLPDPSVVGGSVTVQYSVAPVAPGAGVPTGNVTVSDGVDSCTATVAAGQCDIPLTTVGARTLTATYAGDSSFNGSTSAGEAHTVSPPPPPPGPAVAQLEGDDNVARAIAWSQATFPSGGFTQIAGVTVLLGRDDDFADSLASATAQGALDAPLLLTGGDELDDRVAEELQRLGATNVVLLGGTRALSEEVATALEDLGYDVDRRAGATRLETAVALADAYAGDAAVAALARAHPAEGATDPTQAFADALAGGGLSVQLGVPLLLTEGDRLSAPTAAWLQEAGVERVLILGGTAAVSNAVEGELRDLGIEVDRIDGATRFATATAIAGEGRGLADAAEADGIVLVEGQGADAWADAFPAALLSGRGSAPIVLANGDDLPAPTTDYLRPADIPLTCGTRTTDAACAAAVELLAG